LGEYLFGKILLEFFSRTGFWDSWHFQNCHSSLSIKQQNIIKKNPKKNLSFEFSVKNLLPKLKICELKKFFYCFSIYLIKYNNVIYLIGVSDITKIG
jgi:hypothetical protein